MMRRLMRISISFALLLGLVSLGNVMSLRAEKNKSDKDKPAATLDCKNLEVKAGKEKGKQERFFAYPVDKVKAAVVDGLKAIEFEVKEEKGNQMEAHHKRHVGMFVGSGGETLVVEFAEAKEGETAGTKVMAETKKGFVGRAGQKSWSNAVLDQAECILKGAK